MKRSERHHLKENEVVLTLRRAQEVLERRPREVAAGAVAAIVILASIGGYFAWRSRVETRAQAMLASAMTIAEAPVVPPAPPAAGSTAPPPPPSGSYPSERARLDAALPRFMAAADAHPSTRAGMAARYHAATTLAALNRVDEAVTRYQEVIDRAGGSVYADMARLGLAAAQAQAGRYDRAIAAYTELSTRKDGDLPVDAILVQLGRAYRLAGRPADAVKTFTRVVDEFPASPYAAEARRELDELKPKA